MNDLYRNALPNVADGFSFDDAVLLAALKRIYREDFNPLTDIEENLFNEFWDRLNEAADKGFGEVASIDHDYEFIQALRYNNGVFAAFKVHRMQNDMAAQLLDSTGDLKPFEQWLNDVQPIASHQCRQWFQTEYDTAVKRAHLAAEWRQFEAEADVLPNLEWVPSTSITPGEDHRPFWGMVRPINDSSWNSHKPGDRWGCKCGLRATDKAPTPMGDVPAGGTADKPAMGLDNNPAQDAQVFSDTHPYNPPSCAACTLPGRRVISKDSETFTGRLIGLFNASGKKDCYHCSKPVQLLKKAGVATKEQKRKAKTISFLKAKKNAIDKVKVHVNKSMPASKLQSHNLWDSKWGLKSLLNHSINNDEIKAAMSLPKNFDNLNFIRVSPMGEGKDLSNPVHVKNIAEKKKRGIFQFNIYEYSYKGKTYYIKLAQNKRHGGYEEFYAFTKKP